MVRSICLKNFSLLDRIFFFFFFFFFFLLNSFSLFQSYTERLHLKSWRYFDNASMSTSS